MPSVQTSIDFANSICYIAELYSYEAFRRHLHDDERPVERADLSMLDADKLERYILQRRADRPGFAQLSRQQTLEMLNITRNGQVTLAAVLNFCIYPQGYFPQLGITAVVVPGTQIGDTDADAARFIDNKRIEGTIDSMVEEAVGFCRRNMKTRTIIDPDTGVRADRPEYPVEAIRRAMKEYGLPEPKFENRRNEFVVTLFNGVTGVTTPVEAVQEKTDLLAFCQTPRTRREIADYLGVKTVFYAMGHYVQPLLQAGKLAMTLPETPKSSKQKFYTV